MGDPGKPASERRRRPRPDVSVVIPVYNEEANIPSLEKRLFAALDALGRSHEVVFVDDGSRDRSRELLVKIAEARPNVRVIELARNSGQHAAIFCALAASRGKCVVTLDADLQNPPEEIPKLLAKIDEGYDVVGGWRAKRDDPLFRKLASRVVNYLIRRATGVKLNDYGCMLRAYSRPVARRMARSQEHTSFIPALANTLSSRIAEVEVAHAAREGGESKYSFLKLVKLQFDLMTGFSAMPLQTISWLGIATAVGAVGFGVFLLLRRLVPLADAETLKQEQGIFTLFAVLFFVVGVQFMAIGVLGEYVGRIYTQVRHRPRYVVRKVWRGGSPATREESARLRAARHETSDAEKADATKEG